MRSRRRFTVRELLMRRVKNRNAWTPCAMPRNSPRLIEQDVIERRRFLAAAHAEEMMFDKRRNKTCAA
jgi:hypothetical protein